MKLTLTLALVGTIFCNAYATSYADIAYPYALKQGAYRRALLALRNATDEFLNARREPAMVLKLLELLQRTIYERHLEH